MFSEQNKGLFSGLGSSERTETTGTNQNKPVSHTIG